MHVQEGSLTLFRGPQRSGKTLGMSLFALSDYQKGRKIFTNMAYTFPYEPLYFKELDLNDEEIIARLRKSAVTLDELWMLFDSRSGGSNDSKKFSRWLYQVKKMGVNLYGTTHELHLVDRRLRENFDYLIDVQVYPKKRPEGVPPDVLNLIIQNGPLQAPLTRRVNIRLTPNLLGLYDSENVFDPLAEPEGYVEKKLTPQERGYKPHAPHENINHPMNGWVKNGKGHDKESDTELFEF